MEAARAWPVRPFNAPRRSGNQSRNVKGPPCSGPFVSLNGNLLRGGDVAAELLVQERPSALALVVPVVVAQALVRRVVLVVELAVGRVREARERRARPEERGDPDIGVAAVRRTGCVRIERAAGDRSAQEAAEVARLAGGDSRAVASVRLAGARALALVCQERAVVSAGQSEGAVAVALDREGAQLRIGRPRVPARAVVVGDDAVRSELLAMAVAMAVAVVRKARGCEGESGCQ